MRASTGRARAHCIRTYLPRRAGLTVQLLLRLHARRCSPPSCPLTRQKRGWTETASAFANDAGINEDEWKGPPIEAPQGLLYEYVGVTFSLRGSHERRWWSVFWDVFIARSQSTGKRNVMADTYVEVRPFLSLLRPPPALTTT